MWYIRNINDQNLIWSNDDGWVENWNGDASNATLFSKTEKSKANLSIEGEWVNVTETC